MNNWWIIIGMGVITYAIRLMPILLLERLTLNANLRQALRFVPTAVLSAIILPELLQSSGTIDLSWGNARLLAAVLAAWVAWRTQNVLWTIGVGMITLWILQTIFVTIP